MTTEPTDEQIEAVAREVGITCSVAEIRKSAASDYPWAKSVILIATERLQRQQEQTEHEAFRRDVSDTLTWYFSGGQFPTRSLGRFILPPPVDPRVLAARAVINTFVRDLRATELTDEEILKIMEAGQ